MTINVMRKIPFINLIVSVTFIGALFAQGPDSTPPTTTWNGTRGLSQTYAAEAMGGGRLTVSVLGSWYHQKNSVPSAPYQNADMLTETGSISFGANSYMDVFMSFSGYSLLNTANKSNGLGSVGGGLQAILPLPEKSPVGLGAQMLIAGGTAKNTFNNNRVDGYDYFLNRTDFDFVGRLMQTLKFGTESFGFKLHVNESGVKALAKNTDMIFLLGAGIQADLHSIVALGLEFNSRTILGDAQFRTDPFYLTPSLQFRTPFFLNFNIGADIALSQDRAKSNALEPFRLFGGIVYTQDLLAGRRRAAREKAVQDSIQKIKLADSLNQKENQALTMKMRLDSLAEKSRRDSIKLVEVRYKAAVADSLARAKALQDSLALIETNKKLSEEREKRTDAEKQLLSTGLLILDAVYFESGKAEISINSFAYLNIIAKMLLKYPKLKIEVAGHTDNIGSISSNMTLSQARSEAVRSYLVQAVPGLYEILTSRGYGPTMPKASNSTAAGRKVNRRVELQVLNKDVLKEYNR
jgi:outer membrane protein OmpA-like peptidoglycan-associated protein